MLISALNEMLPSVKIPLTLNDASGVCASISRSFSTINRTATLCTRPALNPRLMLFHNTGLNSYPTNRSSTRRACCASTNSLLILRGFSTARRMAVLVISLKTIRSVFSSFKSRASLRCQAMASPSRSSSDASQTFSAFFAAAFNSLTRVFLSFDTQYSGVNSFSISMAIPLSHRSRM